MGCVWKDASFVRGERWWSLGMIFPLVMGINDLGVFLFEHFPFLHIFLLLFPFVYLIGGFGGLEALIDGVVLVFSRNDCFFFYIYVFIFPQKIYFYFEYVFCRRYPMSVIVYPPHMHVLVSSSAVIFLAQGRQHVK